MFQHFPKQRLGHRRISLTIGMGQRIATGRRRPSHRAQFAGMQAQPITRIVEAKAMGQLHVDQRHHMTPRAKTARLPLNSFLSRQRGNQERRNQIANLT